MVQSFKGPFLTHGYIEILNQHWICDSTMYDMLSFKIFQISPFFPDIPHAHIWTNEPFSDPCSTKIPITTLPALSSFHIWTFMKVHQQFRTVWMILGRFQTSFPAFLAIRPVIWPNLTLFWVVTSLGRPDFDHFSYSNPLASLYNALGVPRWNF